LNSRLSSLYVYAHRSVCLSVCQSSVTLMRPTQATEICGNVSMPFGTLAIHWHPGGIWHHSRGTSPTGV